MRARVDELETLVISLKTALSTTRSATQDGVESSRFEGAQWTAILERVRHIECFTLIPNEGRLKRPSLDHSLQTIFRQSRLRSPIARVIERGVIVDRVGPWQHRGGGKGDPRLQDSDTDIYNWCEETSEPVLVASVCFK